METLETKQEQESYADWVARVNKGIAEINERIRKSNNWNTPGARFGIKVDVSGR